MKRRVKFLISFSLIPLMILSFLTSSLLIWGARADGLDYKQKIVAVVYDDSGSMSTDKRVDYAQYAMQGLVSVLNSGDELVVFPLNNFSSSGGKSVSVDLVSEDRDAIVKDLIKSGELGAGGGTPHFAVKYAVDWLASKGLNRDEVLEDKDFWLVILSDGEFSSYAGSSLTTSGVIKDAISDYVGLQTVYFGICASDRMRIDDLVTENSAVSAYYTSSATEIISAMQDISNRTTGRYTMTKGITQNGSTMVLDLSTCGFSVVSIGVLSQGSSSVGVKNVSCSTTGMKLLRPCSISSPNVNLAGYSAMIAPDNASGYFNGDKITLTFESVPESVTILLEPAIELESTLQHKDNGSWVDVNEETVNTKLKAGAEIRTKYRLVDRLTGKDLTGILTDVTATVSYNGKVTPYDQSFRLETGKKEVALSVTVNIGGSKYTLYNSWICHIDENPSSFSITSNATKDYGGNSEKVKIDYKVIYDNLEISKGDIEGSSAKLTWQLVSLTNPSGQTITPDSAVVNNDGTISVIFSTKQGEYGAYTAKLKVICIENRRTRISEDAVKYFPTVLNLTTGDVTNISLSLNQLKSNTDKYQFQLDSKGFPISFDSGVVDYKLTIGGVDVTSLATISGNTLSFMPDLTTITGSIQNVGKKDVELQVWSSEDNSVKVSKTLNLEILNSTYVVETIPQDNSVDIYDLKNCTAKVYFRASIDGEWLNEEQLREGLDNGTIKVETNPLGWIFLLPTKATTTVETFNGNPVICVSIGTNWFSPLDNLCASMIITGEKKVALRYGNAVGETTFNLNPVPFTSRLWRWLIIIVTIYIIVHIVLWIIGFFVANSLPKGVLVKITIPSDETSKVRKNITYINIGAGSIIRWHLMRFIPFKEFMNQPEESVYSINIYVDDNREQRMIIPKGWTPCALPKKTGNTTYKTFNEFIDRCRNVSDESDNPNFAKDIIASDFIKLLRPKKPYVSHTVVGVSETYYAKKKDGKICEVYVFVRKANR